MSNLPKATHTGELHIGPIIVECAVLNDGTRILTQSSFLRALDRSVRPHGRGSRFEEIAPFLASETLKPYVDKDLAVSSRRIKFAIPGRGQAYGYKGRTGSLKYVKCTSAPDKMVYSCQHRRALRRPVKFFCGD